MKIVFFGSGDFGVPALEALVNSGESILAVITQPDKPKGRHLILSEPAIKKSALRLKLPIYQPQNIKDKKILSLLKDLASDLFVVVNYGNILTKDILSIPQVFAINIHASLLPKYRGAAPINWAIINGETKTGITIIKMNEFMDKGQIILQKEIAIQPQDDVLTLSNKLSSLGAEVLIEAIKKIKDQSFSLIKQEDSQVTLAPKLKKTDGLIDWGNTASEIHNKIRGLVPWPCSFTYYKGKLLKIYKSDVLARPLKKEQAGKIIEISKEAISIGTAKDILLVRELQLESSKRMKVSQFILGHKISIDEKLG